MIEKKKVILRKTSTEGKVTETVKETKMTITANFVGLSTKGTYSRWDIEENSKIKGSNYFIVGKELESMNVDSSMVEKTKVTKNFDRYQYENDNGNGTFFVPIDSKFPSFVIKFSK